MAEHHCVVMRKRSLQASKNVDVAFYSSIVNIYLLAELSIKALLISVGNPQVELLLNSFFS